MKRIATLLAGTSLSLLTLSGCGTEAVSTKQQKTATITFSTISSAHSAPLQVIQMSAKLPSGVSFNSLKISNDYGGQLGNPQYSAATQKVTFMVTSPIKPIMFGTFAVLKCDIAPGFNLDQSSFEAINTPLSDLVLKSGAYNGQTVDLLPEISVKLSVTFGY
jgi:hypothetical protein